LNLGRLSLDRLNFGNLPCSFDLVTFGRLNFGRLILGRLNFGNFRLHFDLDILGRLSFGRLNLGNLGRLNLESFGRLNLGRFGRLILGRLSFGIFSLPILLKDGFLILSRAQFPSLSFLELNFSFMRSFDFPASKIALLMTGLKLVIFFRMDQFSILPQGEFL